MRLFFWEVVVEEVAGGQDGREVLDQQTCLGLNFTGADLNLNYGKRANHGNTRMCFCCN